MPFCCPAQYSRYFNTDCICAVGIKGPIPGVLFPLPNSVDVASSAPDIGASSPDLMFPVEKIIALRSYTGNLYFMSHYKNPTDWFTGVKLFDQ